MNEKGGQMITLLSHTVDDNKEGIAEIPKHYSR